MILEIGLIYKNPILYGPWAETNDFFRQNRPQFCYSWLTWFVPWLHNMAKMIGIIQKLGHGWCIAVQGSEEQVFFMIDEFKMGYQRIPLYLDGGLELLPNKRCIWYWTRKYPLRGYILGVLTHTTALDWLWGGDETLKCGLKIKYT